MVALQSASFEERDGHRCVQCGTTKTPMWRSGPKGSKSLCNACGIRWKKANPVSRRSSRTEGSISRKTETLIDKMARPSKDLAEKKKKRVVRALSAMDDDDARSPNQLMEVIDFYHYKPLFSGLMVVNKKRGF
eukprot:CAMPEP_0198722664 /NCGR_PEP_ID=MMETSP1475-20131203/304_1 /TAXON_ID= ORGANISM="Unidentified sp., Strain CCMP1999" /NCGR_SAMPLE_ID=MMETSP1475 /ASSEMBLY_ACC=CAM_ASM_001111 /LENGTH=132 /DNA_ID=CAMNT_0044483577 /DNA_START=124 /DNA_END=522 /DNA_ORIENTATION=-